MRVVFIKGKQRELIRKEKEQRGLCWREFAQQLQIKEGNLKAYFYEQTLIPERLFDKFSLRKEFKKFILEKKEENWGRIKGGRISPGKIKKINLPKESKKLAEFYGIMLGDGNLNKTKGYKIGTYMIRIVGDSRKDRDYLINFVKPLIESLFSIKTKIGKFKNENAMFVEAHSINLVKFLESKGFKPGNKIKNKLEIPDWIRQNPSFLRSCLRGLYDTDGSIYRLTNQNSHQINFCNKNQYLLNDVRDSLIKLRINPSKISKEKDLYITKRSELKRFLKVVGFHNPKHLNKVKMLK